VSGDRHDLVPGDESALALVRQLQALGAIDEVSLRLGDLHDLMTFERAEGLAALFGSLHRSTAWWIGDLLGYGLHRWGEAGAQLEVATGLRPATITDYVTVAQRIPPSRRVAQLSFRHHMAVRALDPGEQRDWLTKAVAGDWSSSRLREEIADNRIPSAARETGPWPRQLQVEQVIDVARTIVATALPEPDGRVCLPPDLYGRLARAVNAEPEPQR
jgi:hypothetical protein